MGKKRTKREKTGTTASQPTSLESDVVFDAPSPSSSSWSWGNAFAAASQIQPIQIDSTDDDDEDESENDFKVKTKDNKKSEGAGGREDKARKNKNNNVSLISKLAAQVQQQQQQQQQYSALCSSATIANKEAGVEDTIVDSEVDKVHVEFLDESKEKHRKNKKKKEKDKKSKSEQKDKKKKKKRRHDQPDEQNEQSKKGDLHQDKKNEVCDNKNNENDSDNNKRYDHNNNNGKRKLKEKDISRDENKLDSSDGNKPIKRPRPKEKDEDEVMEKSVDATTKVPDQKKKQKKKQKMEKKNKDTVDEVEFKSCSSAALEKEEEEEEIINKSTLQQQQQQQDNDDEAPSSSSSVELEGRMIRPQQQQPQPQPQQPLNIHDSMTMNNSSKNNNITTGDVDDEMIMVLIDKKHKVVYSALERTEDGQRVVIGKLSDDNEVILDSIPRAIGLSGGADKETGAGDGIFPFQIDPDDHCETPFEAYEDVAPFLRKLCSDMELCSGHKQRQQLSSKDTAIYDPYYCDGSVISHLSQLDFSNVHNKKQDCYRTWSTGINYPEFDVLVTNPPYSGDHIERLMEHVANRNFGTRPWFLLMPTCVHKKDYYVRLLKGSGCKPFYLVPRRRYVYVPPKNFRAKKVSDVHKKSSPFISMWYIWGGTVERNDMLIDHYYQLCQRSNGRGGGGDMVEICRCDLARSKSALRDLRRKGKR